MSSQDLKHIIVVCSYGQLNMKSKIVCWMHTHRMLSMWWSYLVSAWCGNSVKQIICSYYYYATGKLNAFSYSSSANGRLFTWLGFDVFLANCLHSNNSFLSSMFRPDYVITQMIEILKHILYSLKLIFVWAHSQLDK